jgi:Uma2 family endonuclease
MADVAEKRMTVAEFLTWDDGTDTRYELVRGKSVAMARPSAAHSIIVPNVGAALHGKLKPRYYAGTTAGVIPPDRDDTFYVADLVVSCTPLQAHTPTIPQPVVVIEVLSPSTIEHDRGRKAHDYRRIPSVREIVLVASEQRHVEVWRRRGAKWEVEDLIGDAVLELETIGITVPFARIHADSGV